MIRVCSSAAPSQQQITDGPRTGVASSATGRQPLGDDRSCRGSPVKEKARVQKGELGARGKTVTCHRGEQRDDTTEVLGLEGESGCLA